AFFGWRSTFYFMVGFGLVTWLLVLIFLAENKKSIVKQAEQTEEVLLQTPIKRLEGYVGVLRNLNFLGYPMLLCSSFAAFRCYSVESPFVFDNQGYPAEEMGSFYISLSFAYIIGNLTAKRLINTMRVEKVLNIGFLFFSLGGLCMVGGSL